MNKFGRLLKKSRDECNLSIVEASELAGISIRRWQYYEAGIIPTSQENVELLIAKIANNN